MQQWSYTLADYPRLVAPIIVKANGDPRNPLTFVVAPCCGRHTPADTIVDVRSIPGTIVRGGGYRPAEDHDWLCDGCLDRMYREPDNDWTLSKMLEARGAPAALVTEHRAREWMLDAEREEHARDKKRKGIEVGPLRDQIKEHVDRLHRRDAELAAHQETT